MQIKLIEKSGNKQLLYNWYLNYSQIHDTYNRQIAQWDSSQF